MQNLADGPLVTVIICVYNAGEYLRPSLESILHQTYQNLEILVVDDGSTDGCMTSIENLVDSRLRLIRQKNGGKPAAMNRAIQEAQGDFYLIHDADDLSHPQRVKLQVGHMLAHADLAAIYCGHELIFNGQHIAPTGRLKGPAECRNDIDHFRMPAHDPTGMYRLSMVKGVDYEPSLHLGEGHDYMLRVGEKYPMTVLGECLYSYRIHNDSITKRVPQLREECVTRVLKRACERRGLDFEATFPERVRSGSKPSSNITADNNLAAHFMDSVCDLRRSGRRSEAISNALICSRLHLLDLHYHKALIYALAPRWMLRRLRSNQTSH